MFHGDQFHAPVMSPLFLLHESYDNITLDDVCLAFHPPMYPIDGEFDSNTRLTLTYSVESDLSEPLYPSMIHLTSDSSSSVASRHQPRAMVEGSFVPELCL